MPVMFTYCPSCASKEIRYEGGKKLFCPACGFTLYQNTAAATGCVISRGKEILVLVRGKEPAGGKYDFPGGFVDPDEGAVDGLRRECMEELGWDFGEKEPVLFASFPNHYPYKGITYNTCDLFFAIDAPELDAEKLCIEKAEIREAKFMDPLHIREEDMAFQSTRLALKAYIAKFRKQ
ncbi:MAG: NUDIX domain-containing protein [Spirochaetaceae bacterium]|jgi:ADP-ribose pyrophosphatase YjhB (NUDIX family)|nr:NUDIX domain-containing protein [Spirochaetaceae bacterium]